jgi:DNA-nicking Smr family endonuclease
LTDDDPDLFRRAMSGAKPLRADKRAALPERKPKKKRGVKSPVERFLPVDHSEPDPHGDFSADDGKSLRFQRASVGRKTIRKLARGGYRAAAEMDLHGMTVAEAQPRLINFINHCVARNHECVRIIHGKGLGSGERGPVLKRGVNRWLRHMDVVLAFVPARPADGGDGAVYVLLRDN